MRRPISLMPYEMMTRMLARFTSLFHGSLIVLDCVYVVAVDGLDQSSVIVLALSREAFGRLLAVAKLRLDALAGHDLAAIRDIRKHDLLLGGLSLLARAAALFSFFLRLFLQNAIGVRRLVRALLVRKVVHLALLRQIAAGGALPPVLSMPFVSGLLSFRLCARARVASGVFMCVLAALGCFALRLFAFVNRRLFAVLFSMCAHARVGLEEWAALKSINDGNSKAKYSRTFCVHSYHNMACVCAALPLAK
eukprot:1911006-Pleurochrysis_carterae.AAC.4